MQFNWTIIYFLLVLAGMGGTYYFFGDKTEAIVIMATQFLTALLTNKGVKDNSNDQFRHGRRSIFKY